MKIITRSVAALLLAAILIFSTVPAFAQQSGNATYTAKFPTTSAMLLVSADPTITGVEIINNGSVTVYLGNASTVTAAATASTDGVPLYANTRIIYNNVASAIYGITSASTANLRIVISRGGGSVESARLQTTGVANSAASGYVPMSNGSDLIAGNVLIKLVTSAITANSTTCSDASGSLAITSNATGLGTVFRCDGTNYQLLAKYSDYVQAANLGTVATTSTTDDYIVAGYAGTLLSLDCSSIVALTANDTNYVTVTLTNLGQAGSGSNPMLAATAPNTSQATGGTGFAANTKRTFTINGTGSNLIVAAGDRLLLRFSATGTLANTLTGTKCIARFNRLS